jgi:cytochrome c oxidase assembly protein subunit 15
MAAFVESSAFSRPAGRAVGYWLIAVAVLIAAMVTVGGLTRLTGSGLSITEWHPVTGVVPPLSDQAWQAEFARYRHIPQYRLENRGMSLADFKAIYWWEWTHRLLGRLLGFVFLLPMLFFIATGAIARAGIPRMVVLFALGGLQGFVGWWMVESGLVTRVSVSQFRLAIHLGVALILFVAIVWTALEYLFPPSRSERVAGEGDREAVEVAATPSPLRLASSGRSSPPPLRGGGKLPFAFVALIYLQMLLGALVAGLHAGLVYNTWPSMNGRVFPENAFASKPRWLSFFENEGLAQFDHRLGAYLIAVGAIWLWVRSRGLAIRVRLSADAVLAVTLVQVGLGIVTLLNQAPVAPAALHQATAVALLTAALWHAFEQPRSPQSAAVST